MKDVLPIITYILKKETAREGMVSFFNSATEHDDRTITRLFYDSMDCFAKESAFIIYLMVFYI